MQRASGSRAGTIAGSGAGHRRPRRHLGQADDAVGPVLPRPLLLDGVVPTGSVRGVLPRGHQWSGRRRRRGRRPLPLPQTMAWYANGNFGIGRPSGTTRARDMAADASRSPDPHVTFGPYDNDGNGYVDAFIVVHSGRGGEETGNSGDIWSHKWVLPSQVTTDSTKVYGYLTIPEDAKLGVSAHELGHLLFGFPTSTTPTAPPRVSATGASWAAARGTVGATRPRPSAWCKVNQGWATVNNITANGTIQHPGRQVLAPGAPPLEGRRRRPRVLPPREPAEDRLRRPAPGRWPAPLARRREQSRRTPTRTTTRWGCSRPTACASWRPRPTAATPATPFPGAATSRVAPGRRRPTPTPSPVRRPRSRSRRSRRRPRR